MSLASGCLEYLVCPKPEIVVTSFSDNFHCTNLVIFNVQNQLNICNLLGGFLIPDVLQTSQNETVICNAVRVYI